MPSHSNRSSIQWLPCPSSPPSNSRCSSKWFKLSLHRFQIALNRHQWSNSQNNSNNNSHNSRCQCKSSNLNSRLAKWTSLSLKTSMPRPCSGEYLWCALVSRADCPGRWLSHPCRRLGLASTLAETSPAARQRPYRTHSITLMDLTRRLHTGNGTIKKPLRWCIQEADRVAQATAQAAKWMKAMKRGEKCPLLTRGILIWCQQSSRSHSVRQLNTWQLS